MGYSTSFEGELRFVPELRSSELSHLKQFLGKDLRDFSGDKDAAVLCKECVYWVALDITDDFSGIKWNGAEKTYGMVDLVNFLTLKIRERCPDFYFEGELRATGEDFNDRWILRMVDGVAVRVPLVALGDYVECPECDHTFVPNATWVEESYTDNDD